MRIYFMATAAARVTLAVLLLSLIFLLHPFTEGRVTSYGWMALISIPFRSIRFHANNSNWGFVLQRVIPRNSENDAWPHIASNISGVLSQEATLST